MIAKKCFFIVLYLCLHASLLLAEKKPNIVVVMADDLGWGDTGTYGHPMSKTPNMDRLASQGVKLTQCYSACGVCSPSRSAMLTGRTPYRNGVWRHLSGSHEAHLRASEITYPELLKKVGYQTCHVGKWHLLSKNQFNNPEYPQPDDQGYDYYLYTHNNAEPNHHSPINFVRNGKPLGKVEGYSAQIVAGEAVSWLNNHCDTEKPFALTVWFHEPHSKIATDPRFENLYKGHSNSKYLGNVTQMDHALGMIMDALEKAGVDDNTFLFFTSDNGPVPAFGGTSGGLRGNKRNSYEGGIRVPGLVKWPGHIKPGSVSDVPVIGTDLFTTVLNIVDVPLPNDRTIDGANMLPGLSGKKIDRKTPLFWRTHVSPGEDRVAMRIGDWKIIANDLLTKFQLYKIQEDWKEEVDLATKMPEKTEEMKSTLINLWKDIEKEGPDHWWKADRQAPKKGATLSY